MANFTIVLPETGLTLIGKVYNSAGVQQGGDVTMTESATNVYTGTYSEAGLAAGTYEEFAVLFSASSVVKGEGLLKVENGVEVNDRLLQDAIDEVNANETKIDALPTAAQIADAVFDEPRADHVAAGSFGQSFQVVRSGTAQAGAASTITLDTGASAINSFYNNTIIHIVTGTGAGQSRRVSGYVGATKVATVANNWQTNPDVTSVFVIRPGGQVSSSVTSASLQSGLDAYTNKNDWKATGFATPTNVTNAQTAIIAEIDANETKIDTIDTNVDSIVAKLPTGNISDFDESTDQVIVATNNDKTDYTLTTADKDDIVDLTWDEPLTGATHNVPTSAGRRVRNLADLAIIDGTAVSSGTGTNQIVLDGDASTVDGAYDPALIAIVNGTGAGQSRIILQYNGTTKTATVDRDWKVNPDATSEYVIYGDAGRQHVNEGLAQAGTTNTITLNALASSATDAYKRQIVFIRSGTGADQVRTVQSYDGTTKIATVTENWSVVPDSTSGYTMIPAHVHEPSEIQSGLATSAEITALNDLSTADIDARLAAYDAPTKAEMDAAFTEVKGATWTTTDTLEAIRDAIDTKASQASVDVIDGLIDTLIDYHDNEVLFLDSDNATEVTQANAYHMAVFNDSGISGGTRVKTVQFQDSVGSPTTITNATRYVLI